ncbi:hypothetical protein FOPE_12423 [Fonsecaea pedrosoi]|nr:hypothetical protein FOPE_12423 [Fonsecaea pedrosoi]
MIHQLSRIRKAGETRQIQRSNGPQYPTQIEEELNVVRCGGGSRTSGGERSLGDNEECWGAEGTSSRRESEKERHGQVLNCVVELAVTGGSDSLAVSGPWEWCILGPTEQWAHHSEGPPSQPNLEQRATAYKLRATARKLPSHGPAPTNDAGLVTHWASEVNGIGRQLQGQS